VPISVGGALEASDWLPVVEGASCGMPRADVRFTLRKPSRDVGDDTVTPLALCGGELLAVGQESRRLLLFDLADKRSLL
jgi:hypothetical protein